MSKWKLPDDVHIGEFGQVSISSEALLRRPEVQRQIKEWASLAAAPSPEWVKTSDRLPTREDADEVENVWIARRGRNGEVIVKTFPAELVALGCYPDELKETHWMPKPRAQPPEPPEEK